MMLDLSERDGDGDVVSVLHYAATAEVIEFAEVSRHLRQDVYVDDACVSGFAVRERGGDAEAEYLVLCIGCDSGLDVALFQARQPLHRLHENMAQG